MQRSSYQHTQIGWLMIGALLLPTAVIVGPLFGTMGFNAILVIISAVVALCMMMFATLSVRVSQGQIVANFTFGFPRRIIRTEDVRFFRKVQNPWYLGWGLRLIPGGTMYNVSGFSAVEFVLRDGTRFRVGTDEPDELYNACRRLLGEPEPLSAGEETNLDTQRRRFSRVATVTTVISVLVITAVMFVTMQPPDVTVTADSYTIKQSAYGETVHKSQIQSVTLEQEMPKVLARTNGFALGKSRKGWFRLEDMGKGKLFVTADQPPYVLVRHHEGLVFINYERPEDTRRLFEQLRKLAPAQ